MRSAADDQFDTCLDIGRKRAVSKSVGKSRTYFGTGQEEAAKICQRTRPELSLGRPILLDKYVIGLVVLHEVP